MKGSKFTNRLKSRLNFKRLERLMTGNSVFRNSQKNRSAHQCMILPQNDKRKVCEPQKYDFLMITY